CAPRERHFRGRSRAVDFLGGHARTVDFLGAARPEGCHPAAVFAGFGAPDGAAVGWPGHLGEGGPAWPLRYRRDHLWSFPWGARRAAPERRHNKEVIAWLPRTTRTGSPPSPPPSSARAPPAAPAARARCPPCCTATRPSPATCCSALSTSPPSCVTRAPTPC